MSARRFPFETVIQRGDAEIEVKGVYSMTAPVAATRWQPAEGGEIEIVTVGRKDGAPLNLTDAEEEALIEECAERSADDWAAEDAAVEEWRAQERRDRIMMGDDW